MATSEGAHEGATVNLESAIDSEFINRLRVSRDGSKGHEKEFWKFVWTCFHGSTREGTEAENLIHKALMEAPKDMLTKCRAVLMVRMSGRWAKVWKRETVTPRAEVYSRFVITEKPYQAAMAALCLGALGSLAIDQWNAMEKHIRQMELNDKPDASWRRMMIREIGDFIRADSREGLKARLEAGEEQAIEELRGKTSGAKHSFAASALRAIKSLGPKDPRSIGLSQIVAESRLLSRSNMEPAFDLMGTIGHPVVRELAWSLVYTALVVEKSVPESSRDRAEEFLRKETPALANLIASLPADSDW